MTVLLTGLLVLACGVPRAAPPATEPLSAVPVVPAERPNVVFFDSGQYADAAVDGLAGTEVCAQCHETEYRHWQQTPHARAITDAIGPDGTAAASCRRCHASLVVSPEADAGRLRLDLQGVGCESCHGPGRDHAEDPESYSGRISGVRDNCPECNFRGLCQVCHNTEGDPDFKYFAAYRRMRHPEPGEDDGGVGEIPLDGTGGPACRRGANQ